MEYIDLDFLQQAILQYLKNNPNFDVSDAGNAAEICEYISNQEFYGSLNIKSEIEIKSVTLMFAMGPDNMGAPLGLCQDLIHLAYEHAKGRVEQLQEIVIAFGCGKWRKPVNKHSNAWYHIWPRSVIALSRLGEGAVMASNYWLSQHVKNYSQKNIWNSTLGKDISWADSNYLALQLITPAKPLHIEEEQTFQVTCTNTDSTIEVEGSEFSQDLPAGAKAIFEVNGQTILRKSIADIDWRDLSTDNYFIVLARDGETRISFNDEQSELRLKEGQSAKIVGPVLFLQRECACGNINCAERHRLISWIPTSVITLRSFFASAIKGPSVNIQLGTFIQGMYYPILVSTGNYNADRLRIVPVEFKLCQNPACENPDQHKKYEGGHCPYCRSDSDPEKVPRKAFDWLILITYPPVYERNARYKCRQCKNLHSSNECPICNKPKGPRPTIVWTRIFNKFLSVDDNTSLDLEK